MKVNLRFSSKENTRKHKIILGLFMMFNLIILGGVCAQGPYDDGDGDGILNKHDPFKPVPETTPFTLDIGDRWTFLSWDFLDTSCQEHTDWEEINITITDISEYDMQPIYITSWTNGVDTIPHFEYITTSGLNLMSSQDRMCGNGYINFRPTVDFVNYPISLGKTWTYLTTFTNPMVGGYIFEMTDSAQVVGQETLMLSGYSFDSYIINHTFHYAQIDGSDGVTVVAEWDEYTTIWAPTDNRKVPYYKMRAYDAAGVLGAHREYVSPPITCIDNDGDGYCEDDCDNNDASIYPGAPELCGDLKDNQCPGDPGYGLIDETCLIEEIQITTDPADDWMPSFSPDGTKIVFVSDRSGTWEIYTMKPDGSYVQPISSDPASFEYRPKIGPCGDEIVYLACPQAADMLDPPYCNCDLNRMYLSNGSIVPIVSSGTVCENMVSWKGRVGDSWIVYSREDDGDSEIYKIRPNGMANTKITDNDFIMDFPMFISPDMSKLSFVRKDMRSYDYPRDLYTVNMDGTGEVRLTQNQGKFNGGGSWSPDMQWLGFWSSRNGVNDLGNDDLFVMRSDGASPIQLTTNPTNDRGGEGGFTHDGAKILFVSDRTGNWDIWTFGMKNTDPGSNVALQFYEGGLVFDQVDTEGTTEIQIVDTDAIPNPPVGENPIGKQFEVTTTATYTGNIEICSNYDESAVIDENNLKLMHFDGASWVDVTTSLDTNLNEICGSVTSLSPFAVMEESSTCPIDFPDVPEGHWAHSYIEYLFCNGIVNGYPDGTFQPANFITRGQFAKMIVNANGIPEYYPPTPTFSDVPSDHWSYGYVEAAVQAGIISGYTDGTFRPGNQVTRAQISAMIARSRGWTYSGGLEDFTDVPPSHWAYDNIMSMKEKGIIGGYPDGTFLPANQATRGQNSKMIANMMQTPT